MEFEVLQEWRGIVDADDLLYIAVLLKDDQEYWYIENSHHCCDLQRKLYPVGEVPPLVPYLADLMIFRGCTIRVRDQAILGPYLSMAKTSLVPLDLRKNMVSYTPAEVEALLGNPFDFQILDELTRFPWNAM